MNALAAEFQGQFPYVNISHIDVQELKKKFLATSFSLFLNVFCFVAFLSSTELKEENPRAIIRRGTFKT